MKKRLLAELLVFVSCICAVSVVTGVGPDPCYSLEEHLCPYDIALDGYTLVSACGVKCESCDDWYEENRYVVDLLCTNQASGHWDIEELDWVDCARSYACKTSTAICSEIPEVTYKCVIDQATGIRVVTRNVNLKEPGC